MEFQESRRNEGVRNADDHGPHRHRSRGARWASASTRCAAGSATGASTFERRGQQRYLRADELAALLRERARDGPLERAQPPAGHRARRAPRRRHGADRHGLRALPGRVADVARGGRRPRHQARRPGGGASIKSTTVVVEQRSRTRRQRGWSPRQRSRGRPAQGGERQLVVAVGQRGDGQDDHALARVADPAADAGRQRVAA